MQPKPIKKIQLNLYPKILIRTPQFHLGAELDESWEELKASISHSSPEFFERIKDSTADQLDRLPDAMVQTVHKYFNRAKYRSTPFGSFAGISLLDLAAKTDQNSIQIYPNLALHHFPDWAAMNCSAAATRDELKPASLLIANSSHYPCGQALRYLSKTEERYQLCELANTPIVRDILGHCKTAISYTELMYRLSSPSVKKRQLISLVKEMIAAHLLLHATGPGILGDHPKTAGNSGKNTYIIAERKIHSGKLNTKALTHLPALIGIMSRIKPQQNPPALTDFIQNFLAKFGTEQIPLLQVLDPDQGIGYAGLEHSLDQSELVNVLCKQNQQSKEPEQQLKETLLSRLIFAATSQGNPLRLEEIPLGEIGVVTPTLPNSLSALVSVLGEHICISSLGSCTANALMGRFSIASPQIEACCRQIAGLEQQSNPEVIFFDISYTGEKNTGNINRRAAIYTHQLNILNPGSSADSIPLNELLLCVRDGELILSSAILGKRLVPRMASAYNYLRSELPLFRLLCDLQHQGIQSSPIIELEQLLPGLQHYPSSAIKTSLFPRKNGRSSAANFRTWH
ncbi:MAG: lantibiotic dehydratase [Bacteroidota bacterium]